MSAALTEVLLSPRQWLDNVGSLFDLQVSPTTNTTLTSTSHLNNNASTSSTLRGTFSFNRCFLRSVSYSAKHQHQLETPNSSSSSLINLATPSQTTKTFRHHSLWSLASAVMHLRPRQPSTLQQQVPSADNPSITIPTLSPKLTPKLGNSVTTADQQVVLSRKDDKVDNNDDSNNNVINPSDSTTAGEHSMPNIQNLNDIQNLDRPSVSSQPKSPCIAAETSVPSPSTTRRKRSSRVYCEKPLHLPSPVFSAQDSEKTNLQEHRRLTLSSQPKDVTPDTIKDELHHDEDLPTPTFAELPPSPSSFLDSSSFSGLLSRTQACDLVRVLILLSSVYLFHCLVDISEVYHFIRAQNLMKMYVIFNMLEIFERLWRFFGRDTMDLLLRKVVSLPFVCQSGNVAASSERHFHWGGGSSRRGSRRGTTPIKAHPLNGSYPPLATSTPILASHKVASAPASSTEISSCSRQASIDSVEAAGDLPPTGGDTAAVQSLGQEGMRQPPSASHSNRLRHRSVSEGGSRLLSGGALPADPRAERRSGRRRRRFPSNVTTGVPVSVSSCLIQARYPMGDGGKRPSTVPMVETSVLGQSAPALGQASSLVYRAAVEGHHRHRSSPHVGSCRSSFDYSDGGHQMASLRGRASSEYHNRETVWSAADDYSGVPVQGTASGSNAEVVLPEGAPFLSDSQVLPSELVGLSPRLFEEKRKLFSVFKRFWDSTSSVRHFVLYTLLVLMYMFVHSCFHLVRVLLLNIAINSSDSVMFLIVTTNNFAEIKSTVFKKFTRSSLFPIASSDAIERFYLFVDALIVLLRLSVSVRPPIVSYINVTWWLMSMLFLELMVDWFKHAFLIKLNAIESDVFEQYQQVLVADILVCRMRSFESSDKMSPTSFGISSVKSHKQQSRIENEDASKVVSNDDDNRRRDSIGEEGLFSDDDKHTVIPDNDTKDGKASIGEARHLEEDTQILQALMKSWSIPCRGSYSFPHACARRIGFVGLPLTAHLLCSIPRLPFRLSPLMVTAAVGLLWFNLFLLTILVSLWLVSVVIRRRSKLRGLNLELDQLGAL